MTLAKPANLPPPHRIPDGETPPGMELDRAALCALLLYVRLVPRDGLLLNNVLRKCFRGLLLS